MNLFNRLRGLFGGAPGGSSGGGFFGGLRGRIKERRREREYERSQRRQEKMDKERRREEEKKQKAEDRQKREEADRKARDTFKERWGFDDNDYDSFIQFISGMDDLKEVIGSENLVEMFRTGKSYGLNPGDMQYIIRTSYNTTEGGTAEDLINNIYTNMEDYAQNIKYGAYV